jgi:hypothetical protein
MMDTRIEERILINTIITMLKKLDEGIRESVEDRRRREEEKRQEYASYTIIEEKEKEPKEVYKMNDRTYEDYLEVKELALNHNIAATSPFGRTVSGVGGLTQEEVREANKIQEESRRRISSCPHCAGTGIADIKLTD